MGKDGISGYGLYGENVYLTGSLVTLVKGNSYAGVNTLNGVTATKFKGNSGAIVKFSTINDMEHSEELVKKTIFIESSSAAPEALENYAQENFEDYISGFDLYNQDDIFIGEITAYYNYPNNPCIEVELTDGIYSALSENASAEHETLLIPFQESLILAFDAENREIQMTIPSGLVSIN